MWGSSIIGFGTYDYPVRERFGEGDSALASCSPRSQHLAIYLVGEFEEPARSRCWRGWARTRPERAACISGASMMWTRMRCVS